MRRPLTIASVSLIVAALAACTTPAPGPGPDPTTATPSSPAAQTVTVDVFFSHPQPTSFTLISELHTIDISGDGVETALDTVLGALIDGSVQPHDPDYVNLWGGGSALLSTSRAADVLTIDLSVATLSLGAEAEAIAVAQLVWTAMGVEPSLTAVQLTIDGVGAETLAGHVDISSPLSPEPPENVLSPLQITAPAEGASVMRPVVAAGLACVFEATFAWNLEGPSGSFVEGFDTADGGCPTRAPWQLELGDLAPGDYVLTVIEHSAEDGSVRSTDSKAFTVTG